MSGEHRPDQVPTNHFPMSPAAQDVLDERARQVAEKGWSPTHDDSHPAGALACAGTLYAWHASDPDRHAHGRGLARRDIAPVNWPWEARRWKPGDPRRDLVRAAALLLAEIERMDRAAGGEPGSARKVAAPEPPFDWKAAWHALSRDHSTLAGELAATRAERDRAMESCSLIASRTQAMVEELRPLVMGANHARERYPLAWAALTEEKQESATAPAGTVGASRHAVSGRSGPDLQR